MWDMAGRDRGGFCKGRGKGRGETEIPCRPGTGRATAVRVLSVFHIGQPRTAPTPPLRNRAIFRPWATVVDGPSDFFKHEDSGTGPALARRFVALREGSTQVA
jgi:hypothetical protein